MIADYASPGPRLPTFKAGTSNTAAPYLADPTEVPIDRHSEPGSARQHAGTRTN